MHDSGKKTVSLMVGIVMLIAGLGVGFGVAKAMDNDSSNKEHAHSTVSSGKASDLRSTLVRLGTEHMIMTDQAVADALDASPAAASTAKALYTNGTDLGAAVGSVYGDDAENTFNTVWKLHLDQFVAYAVAGSKGDEAAKAKALSTIDEQYTKPLAAYLAKANPNLSQETLETALRDHVDMTANIIDLHVAGKYDEEAAELSDASKHLEGLMSTLAAGIVKQYPDKFKD
jgi:hypothetical protein